VTDDVLSVLRDIHAFAVMSSGLGIRGECSVLEFANAARDDCFSYRLECTLKLPNPVAAVMGVLRDDRLSWSDLEQCLRGSDQVSFEVYDLSENWPRKRHFGEAFKVRRGIQERRYFVEESYFSRLFFTCF
jgi:hypothetical protein